MKTKITTLIILIIIYILLKHYIPYGDKIVYPITLLVTFLHEFGHSFFALVTGGSVKGIEINSDGSGYAVTAGGVRNLVLMGGYIGSAIFGNILLYIGFKSSPNLSGRRGTNLSEKIIYFLALLMTFVAIFWFNSIFSSLILFALAGLFFVLAKYTSYDAIILQFLGISSIIYIIEDFNVGPSSDLAKFSTFLPSSVWMIIWLVIVILITGFNLRLIFKK